MNLKVVVILSRVLLSETNTQLKHGAPLLTDEHLIKVNYFQRLWSLGILFLASWNYMNLIRRTLQKGDKYLIAVIKKVAISEYDSRLSPSWTERVMALQAEAGWSPRPWVLALEQEHTGAQTPAWWAEPSPPGPCLSPPYSRLVDHT